MALELASRGVVASACALAPIGFWSARERAFTQASMRNTRALSKLTRPFATAMARNPAVRYAAFRQYLAQPGNMSVEDIVESVDPTGPFGAKGVGEPTSVPTAAAILNAIYDAVGVRLTSLPATAQRVLEAIEADRRLSPSAAAPPLR